MICTRIIRWSDDMNVKEIIEWREMNQKKNAVFKSCENFEVFAREWKAACLRLNPRSENQVRK